MTYYTNELYHHGIKGQKWGVRRYQNADGTLTAKGAKRYKRKADKLADKLAKTAVAYNQQAKSTKTIGEIKINDEPITIQQLSRKDTNAWYKAAKKADRYGQKLERRGYQTSISSSQIGKGKQYVEAIVNGEVSRKYI